MKKYSGINQGIHNFTWGAKKENQALCPSGVYFYKLTSETESITKKLLIIR